MGCCGDREKGTTVTEEQKWTYIVSTTPHSTIPVVHANSRRRSLTSSPPRALHPSLMPGSGSSSSSLALSTLPTPLLPSTSSPSTSGQARSSLSFPLRLRNGSSPSPSSFPMFSSHTVGLEPCASCAQEASQNATSSLWLPYCRVCA